MTSDAEIDRLFTSGYTLATETSDAPVPCDFTDQDAQQQGEEGLGGMVLNQKTVLVRASAFSDLQVGNPVILSDDEDNEKRYTVAEPPRRIQDGLVMQISLQVESAT